MSAMQIELKPCPFCGKAAQIAPDEIGSGGQHVPPYHAGCFRGAGCGIAFTADDPDEAIEEWNRRSLTSATPPDVAKIADAIEACDWSHVSIGNKAILRQAATALRLSAGGGVPEGWKLVPVEPTPEMIGAFWRQKNCGTQGVGERGPQTDDYSAYRAMLAASPTVEAGR